MKKVYYLKSCSTCIRILKELNIGEDFELQNIKIDAITPDQLDEMKALSRSYESLFSRKSMKYKALGLKDKTLSEDDYKSYILEEYTFLKRPVFIIDKEIFIGNSKENVANVQEKLK